MLKKKVLTIITTLSMITSLLPGLVFAQTPSWELKYTGEEKTNRSKYYAQIIDTNSCNGDNSLKIAYPDAEVNGTYVEIINALPENLPSGDYNLSLNYKLARGARKTGIKFIVGETEILMSDSSWVDENVTGDSGETGWKKLSGVVSYTQTTDAKFIIKATGDITGCFIDDIVLTAENSDENLITAGDFEGAVLVEEGGTLDPDPTPDPDPNPNPNPNPDPEPEPEPEPEGEKRYVDELSPQRAIIQSFELSIMLTWYNPQKSNISKVSLYEIIDDEEVLLTDSLPTSSGERQEYKAENLVLDDIHNYKIVNEYNDGDSREFYINSKVKSGDGDKHTKLGQNWLRLGIAAAYIMYDTMEKHSGEASLKFTSNMRTPLPNYYACFRQICSALEEDKDYELSFWIKANEIQQFLIEMNWDTSRFDQDGDVLEARTSNGKYEWKKITLTKTKDEIGYGPLMFMFNHSAEFWIDDILLREKFEDGTYGENMIADGDFESFKDSIVLDKVSNIKTNGYDREVSISWDMPDKEKCTEVRIYEKIGDNWATRGTVNADLNSINFTHMVPDTDYTFKICPINSLNKEGEGTEVTVHTVLPDFVINDPVLYNSQNQPQVGSLSAGTYKIVSSVKNHKVEGGLKLEMFAGVYKQNELIALYSTPANISKTEKTANPDDVTISNIVIPQDGEEYVIRVFWIDQRTTQNALRSSVNF